MNWLIWLGFFAIFIGVLALDLGVLHREAKAMHVRKALGPDYRACFFALLGGGFFSGFSPIASKPT